MKFDKCPKCGHATRVGRVTDDPWGCEPHSPWYSGPKYQRDASRYQQSEWLAYACRVCAFSWEEPTADNAERA